MRREERADQATRLPSPRPAAPVEACPLSQFRVARAARSLRSLSLVAQAGACLRSLRRSPPPVARAVRFPRKIPQVAQAARSLRSLRRSPALVARVARSLRSLRRSPALVARVAECLRSQVLEVAVRRRGAARELGLTDEWRAWIVDNLLVQVPPRAIQTALVSGGIPRHVADREIRAIAASPTLAACGALRRRARDAERVLDLYKALDTHQQVPVERREKPTAAEFFSRYFDRNVPVVFTDFTADCRARAWTPEGLAEKLGDAEMGVVRGREGDPEYDRNPALRTTMPARDYIAELLARSPTNDLYSVANNQNMGRAAFVSLLEDVVVDPSYFVPEELRLAGTSFWLGPAGTVTPFHHDTTNILFSQLYGRKRFVLAAPFERALLGSTRAPFYSDRDPEAEPDGLAGVRLHTVDLAPGESLFLPVGYWHQVRALDVSISFSLLCFRRPNRFGAYTPGV